MPGRWRKRRERHRAGQAAGLFASARRRGQSARRAAERGVPARVRCSSAKLLSPGEALQEIAPRYSLVGRIRGDVPCETLV